MEQLDAARLRAGLGLRAAIEALRTGLGAGSLPETPARTVVPAGTGTLLQMPAVSPSLGTGVKLVTVRPENAAAGVPVVHGVYVLFDAATLAPRAVLDGTELTRLRTAAVSALATDLLARPGAATLLVFGTGVQAEAHVEALGLVRELTRVIVVGRRPQAAAALVARLRAGGVPAEAGEAGAVGDADIVCTCTTAATPLFDGAALAPGAHVCAIGSFQPHTREIDATTLRRSRVVLEDRDAVWGEAGDVLLARDEGAFAAEDVVADLRELVRGARVRTGDEEITTFKSVGVAYEDLIVAAAALDAVQG